MTCPLCTTVEQIRARAHSQLIKELPETYAVLGENQGCRAWCVLILKEHKEHLSEMGVQRQARIFEDVARVAGAIKRVTAAPRINYECLGNQVAHVHWHVIPRHANDPDPKNPVWGWTPERLRGKLTDDERSVLVSQLRAALTTT